jgi:hypothetical protein
MVVISLQPSIIIIQINEREVARSFSFLQRFSLAALCSLIQLLHSNERITHVELLSTMERISRFII